LSDSCRARVSSAPRGAIIAPLTFRYIAND